MRRFESNISRMLFRLEPVAAPVSTQVNATETRGEIIDPNQDPDASDESKKLELPTRQPVVNNQKTLGRNDPCWCGSGKKFKKCHYPELN